MWNLELFRFSASACVIGKQIDKEIESEREKYWKGNGRGEQCEQNQIYKKNESIRVNITPTS